MARIEGSKYRVWSGTADVTAGGKTKKDILRLPAGKTPNGKQAYRYVFKSRHNHGKKIMQNNPDVAAKFAAQRFNKV